MTLIKNASQLREDKLLPLVKAIMIFVVKANDEGYSADELSGALAAASENVHRVLLNAKNPDVANIAERAKLAKSIANKS